MVIVIEKVKKQWFQLYPILDDNDTNLVHLGIKTLEAGF